MKVVPDSMMWVSYATHRDGVRHATINRAADRRVRLLTSQYILSEVERVLAVKFQKPRRFIQLAIQKILRMAIEVSLPRQIGSYVPGDPADDGVLQTAVTGKADFIVTADQLLLDIGKIQDVEIIDLDEFASRLTSHP